jgi:DNA-binding NarL/FixJ family response regulator
MIDPMTEVPGRVWRIGVVDDHEQIVRGLRATLDEQADMELVAGAETVTGLLATATDLDLVLLDLRLGDGTSPITNIETLQQVGIPTLVYTSGDEMYMVRQAASAGVMGVVRKNAREDELLAAMRQALSGDTVPSIDWAAAIDSDPGFVDLSPQLRRVLELYAAGESSARVAKELDISAETVTDYVNRIRGRYNTAGRPAPTKTDLYKRAIEDGWLPIPRRFRR